MLKRLEVYLIALVLLLITGIVLTVFTMEREYEFKSNNHNIEQAVVQSAVYAINMQLQNKRRLINLFLDEYAMLFRHLVRFPENERDHDYLNSRLKERFQDFFTYTIADESGVPVLTDIDSLVGEACQADLNRYARKMGHDQDKPNNSVFIHPQPYHYHYDIMAPLILPGEQSRIFFASFHLDQIADILKTHEIPGQQLFIVRQSEPDLIEVSRSGARDELKRKPELTPEEKTRILVFENIPQSDWRVVVLPDKTLESDYIEGLWKEVIIVLIILSIASFVMISIAFSICDKQRHQE